MIKNQYERKHPIDWQNGKCVICKLLLKIDTLAYNVPNSEISCVDFLIRYEHKFWRKIYSDFEIAESPQICTLKNYYVAYRKFNKICISLLALLGGWHVTKDEDQFNIDHNLTYPETDLEELRSKTDSVEIKNIIKSKNGNKIPRFNLKVYACVYDAMIDFPQSNFIYDTITTINLFRNVHRLIKFKGHLHHSQITGKMLGYSCDFCNWNVRENKSEIVMIGRNLLGFDMFFFIKRYRPTAWDTKDLNFGWANLTHKNYGNIAGEITFIDTLEYYQKRVGAVAATLSKNPWNS